MKQEQLLKKIINKAIEHGFKFEKIEKIELFDDGEFYYNWETRHDGVDKNNKPITFECEPLCCGKRKHFNEIIFNEKFAKAIWGNAKPIKCIGAPSGFMDNHDKMGWQFHLQQLILEKNKLKYIAEFL